MSVPFWNGEQLRGTVDAPIAIDTETALIASPLESPALALAGVADASGGWIVHPSRLVDFLDAHAAEHFVGHNLAFDFWVIDRHLQAVGRSTRVLWNAADAGRLHDTMLLDLLLQLATGEHRPAKQASNSANPNAATGGDRIFPANLGVLAGEIGIEIDKTDPYRLRYGELVGASQDEMSNHAEWDGFARYAIGDVHATYAIYPQQRARAIAAMRAAGWGATKNYTIRPDALVRFGPLSESIQVRASIALAKVSREPMRIDRQALAVLRDQWTAEVVALVERLDAEAPGMFKRAKKTGEYKRTPKAGTPCQDKGVLRQKLLSLVLEHGWRAPMAGGVRGGISLSAKAWRPWADRSSFLADWIALELVIKRLGMLSAYDADAVYTRYDVLKATGRTGAAKWPDLPGANLQQVPRDPVVRSVFVADSGCRRAVVDYGYLELRTLAACCRAKFGKSSLADVIESHTRRPGASLDPHERTAAAVLGVTVDEWKRLPADRRKKARQSAKAVNFGFPGGLGASRFAEYAKATYDLVVTPKEAKQLRAAWIEAYPEMAQWLADDSASFFATNIGRSRAYVDRVFGRTLRDVQDAAGGDVDAPGVLRSVARHVVGQTAERVELRALLAAGKGSPRRRSLLFGGPVATLTGRVRRLDKFAECKNTPFQGIAADGAKEAVWRLLFDGFRVKAFIHDEIIVDFPSNGLDDTTLRRVSLAMVREMERVIGEGVPVAVEGVVSERWAK